MHSFRCYIYICTPLHSTQYSAPLSVHRIDDSSAPTQDFFSDIPARLNRRRVRHSFSDKNFPGQNDSFENTREKILRRNANLSDLSVKKSDRRRTASRCRLWCNENECFRSIVDVQCARTDMHNTRNVKHGSIKHRKQSLKSKQAFVHHCRTTIPVPWVRYDTVRHSFNVGLAQWKGWMGC